VPWRAFIVVSLSTTLVCTYGLHLIHFYFSSGNHGAALALAAKMRGISATIVVPTGTPKCKVDAIQGYGGKEIGEQKERRTT
jgi:hypothetical protein